MAVERRRPRWDELRPLLQVEAPAFRQRRARALARAQTVEDLRGLARRRVPRAVFDYVDGGAEAEVSLTRARQAFRDVQLRPRVLRDVREVDPATTVLGDRCSLPLVLAPTGFTRMLHHEGERAVVRAAQRAGVPYALSTMGTVSVEDLAATAPTATRWFQLYLWQDRAASRELVRRAAAAGYTTLVLTVDTAVAGRRLRDVRNGLSIPPALRARTLADMARRPHWWVNLLTTAPLEFASLRQSGGTVADLVDRMFDPTLTLDDLAWLREQWEGPVVVKGVLRAEDATAVVEAGADGVVVSSHGGRQLDRAATPLHALPEVAAAVGDRASVLLDTGVLDGADIVTAVANGADAVMVGRAYLYGLMAGGEAGVTRALSILHDQVTRTMRLLGATTVDQLTPDHAALGPPRRHLEDSCTAP